MGINRFSFKQDNYKLIFLLVSLLTFVILFSLRSLDDNRLTSWQWVFAGVNPLLIYLLLAAGFLISFLTLKVSVPARYSGFFLFSGSFAVSMLFWNEPEVIIDAARYFTQAKYLELYGVKYFLREWGDRINAWTDLPLMPFLYGLIFKYFGEARLYIQIFTTTLFSLTVVITYMIGRELWDEDAGFYGGLLLLGIPYLFTQTPLMLVDVPTMFFLMLSVFAFLMALRKGGGWLFFAPFAIFLAVLSKYSAWLMMSVLFIVFLTVLRDSGIKTRIALQRTAFAVAGVVFLTGIVYWYKGDIFWEQIRLLIDYQKPGLSRWGESFVSTFFFQVHPFITIAALYSAYAAFKKKDFKYLIIAWLMVLVIVLQIRRIRYIIMVFPMLALMASYGFSEIQRKDVRKFIVCCVLISSLVIAGFCYLPFLNTLSAANLKQAGEFLDTLQETEARVYTVLPDDPAGELSVSVPLLDLFTRKRIIYLPPGEEEGTLSEEHKTSPLRFTWEYRPPEYYNNLIQPARPEETAIVVIADDTETELPAEIRHQIKDYSLSRQFMVDEDIFLYKTMVSIYLKTKSVQ